MSAGRTPDAFTMTDSLDPDLELIIDHQDGVTVVAVRGELDAASTPHLQERLATLADPPSGAIVLDLSDCGFVDSTGLHAIIETRAALDRDGGRLALVAQPRGPVARVIEVALPGVMRLHPSRAEAMRAVAG